MRVYLDNCMFNRPVNLITALNPMDYIKELPHGKPH